MRKPVVIVPISESVHPPPLRIGAASDEPQPWFPARHSELCVPTVDRMHELMRETVAIG